MDAAGHQVAQRRFVVNAGTFRQLMRWCEQWPERRFAVEGAGGLGRSLAQQLAAAGENVVDVPSTLSARARLLATGGDRKTDAKGRWLGPMEASKLPSSQLSETPPCASPSPPRPPIGDPGSLIGGLPCKRPI